VTVAANIATVTFNEAVCRRVFWNAVSWEITVNGVVAVYEDLFDTIPQCNAAASNGVTSANLFLMSAPPIGSTVAVTLTEIGRIGLQDADGNVASGPQTRTATAATPETVLPTIVSATGPVGSTTLTLVFSEAVYCTAFFVFPGSVGLTDNNPATIDPVVIALGSDTCGFTQTTADTSFSLLVNSPFPGNTTYTATLFPSPNQIQDVFGNDLPNPSSVTFATGAPDFTPPTLIDARIVNNVGNTDFGDVGDAFTVTFSERMNGSTTGGIALQDQDGSTATVLCGPNSSCIWNTATDTVTVTVTTPMPSGGGTTPGQQIPMNVVFLFGFTDEAGNAPNVLGSSDRLIDYE
jgi:hypothetical protein